MRPFIFITVLSFVLVGCVTSPESLTGSEVANDVYIELLSEPLFFEKTSTACQSDSSASCTSVTITYPYFSGTLNPEAEQVVNEKIKDVLVNNMLYDSLSYPDFETFSSAFIREFEEVLEDFPQAFGWQYDADVTILRNDSAVLSLMADVYLYTGGAHGMKMVKFLNLDPATGESYTAGQIFTGGLSKSLNEKLREVFLRQKGLRSWEETADRGYYFENDRLVTDNFGLTRDSVVFYYNQYEIAPYSAGPTRLAVPLDSLEGLMLYHLRHPRP